MFKKVGKFVGTEFKQTTKSVGNTAKNIDTKNTYVLANQEQQTRFKRIFMSQMTQGFNVGDLIAEFPCNALNGTQVISGACFISTQCFLFNAGDINVVIPFTSVINLQQAISGRLNDGQIVINPISSTIGAIPNAIQLFTNDNLIHQFFDFGGLGYNQAWPLCYNQWNRFVSQMAQPYPTHVVDNTPKSSSSGMGLEIDFKSSGSRKTPWL